MNNLTHHFIEYLHGPRNRNTTTGAKSNPNIKGLHHFLYQAPVSSSFGSFTSSKLVSIVVLSQKLCYVFTSLNFKCLNSSRKRSIGN